MSLEWDTVQSTHCSLCQRVAKLSVSGRRCASAALVFIVSAARDCSPPLGVIQHLAVVHNQKWSFKPGGDHISSSEFSAVMWSVSEHLSVTFIKIQSAIILTTSKRNATRYLMYLADVPSGLRFSAKLSALQQSHFSVNNLKDVATAETVNHFW